jgi:hypothetical protein
MVEDTIIADCIVIFKDILTSQVKSIFFKSSLLFVRAEVCQLNELFRILSFSWRLLPFYIFRSRIDLYLLGKHQFRK